MHIISWSLHVEPSCYFDVKGGTTAITVVVGWLLGWLAGWFTFSGELLPKKIKKNVRIWETREFQPATTSRRNNNEPKGQLTTTTSLQLPIFRLETSLQGINVENFQKKNKKGSTFELIQSPVVFLVYSIHTHFGVGDVILKTG
jgi:hypothetical protein